MIPPHLLKIYTKYNQLFEKRPKLSLSGFVDVSAEGTGGWGIVFV
jgi:hypothetical protein